MDYCLPNKQSIPEFPRPKQANVQLLSIIAVCGLTASVSARSARSVGKKVEIPRPRLTIPVQNLKPHKRDTARLITTEASKAFTVNGSAGAIPQVDFDIGESYAGLLPISSASNETSKLYFWFFPSHNPNATDEITIWLNGEHMSVFILGCF
ncbi:hypothetical protein ACJQWK_07803 [Exserohilum turcicum]